MFTPQQFIEETIAKFREKFLIPKVAKTILERDTCEGCLRLKKDGAKNRYGNQIYCSAYHAYERPIEAFSIFPQDDPPKPKEIEHFLHSRLLALLELRDKELKEKIEKTVDSEMLNESTGKITVHSHNYILCRIKNSILSLLPKVNQEK